MEGSIVTFRRIRSPIWTENKARLIERYLYYFVMITKHGAYIDGFAGPQQPDKPETWAAKLVLESQPRWLRSFFLCDNDRVQAKRLEELKIAQPARQHGEPSRTIEIYSADFNTAVQEILKSDEIGDRTATFSLLDQRTFQCHWQTLRVLACHKSTGMKIELFYFLPSGWLDRSLAGIQDESLVEAWWGNSDWSMLREVKGRDRAELFCDRFRNELGYKHAFAWPIYERNDGGRIMYDMIHATDHTTAPNLMSRAYKKAVTEKEPLDQLQLEFGQWLNSGT